MALAWDEGIEDAQGQTDVRNENCADAVMNGRCGVAGLDLC